MAAAVMRSSRGVLLGTYALGCAVALSIPHVARYTEIDWEAYMAEVEGPLLRGDWDYAHLEGATGPLVYPAGFVYMFMALRAATSEGKDIAAAQLIFSLVHVLVMALALASVYAYTDSTPRWVVPLAVLSRRAHSIFSLRLFNDGVAMLFAYACVLACCWHLWTLATVALALGVSVKMNVLLFAPGFAIIILDACGLWGAVWRAALFAGIHMALAWPFLAVNPAAYVHRSFDLGRVFLMEWTVNWKFLDEKTFQSPRLAMGLLALTVATWAWFAHTRWSRRRGGLVGLVRTSLYRADGSELSGEHVVAVLMESNFVGIVFARSLHYQFYCWFAHALPFLVWRSPLFARARAPAGVALWAAVELCFNVFPATPASSLLLQASLYLILLGLAQSAVATAQGVKRD